MKHDEIIEMAREAGAISYKLPNYLEPSGILFSQIELEAFAKLVAAKEREACAKVAESMSLTSANMSKTWRTGCRDVAEAIKARGEA